MIREKQKGNERGTGYSNCSSAGGKIGCRIGHRIGGRTFDGCHAFDAIYSGRCSHEVSVAMWEHPDWYAICTRARHEQVVRQQLTHKGIETFLPTTTRWSRWKDRRKKIEWPLFTGYCFARFNLLNTLRILQCSGVLQIVSVSNQPAAIPESEITSLKLLIESQIGCDPCPFIREGAMVEVIGGPLRGVVGRLLTKNAKAASVVLSVESIGQAVRVQVDAGDIDLR